MPRRTYNTFYKGVQQDDFLTGGANFIEYNNIDGIKNGYGATLGPKVNKQILTSTTAMRGIDGQQLTSGDLIRMYAGGDGGNIYRLSGTDNTPVHTLASGDDIINVVLFGSYLYFFHKPALNTTPYNISRILINDANVNNWGAFDENWMTGFSHAGTTPILIVGNFMYFGSNKGISRLDTSGVVTSQAFPDDDVVGLTIQGTTIKAYSVSGVVYYWNGDTSQSFSSSQKISSRISSADSDASIDYMSTENGDLRIWSGYTAQRVSRKKKSLRLNDNSQYITKLNFSEGDHHNHSIRAAEGDIYLNAIDTTIGIYKYGNIIEGLAKGLQKIVTTDNTNTNVDEIYDMYYLSKTLQSLFFSYNQGSLYGIDYIDLSSDETTQDGYMVTDVFTGGTTFNKQLDRIRMTTSYTSGSNFVKLYMRLDNQSGWQLLQTINNTTDTIKRENISLPTGNFVDIQFKVELHNDTQDDTPPILHELSFDYTIIQQ